MRKVWRELLTHHMTYHEKTWKTEQTLMIKNKSISPQRGVQFSINLLKKISIKIIFFSRSLIIFISEIC